MEKTHSTDLPIERIQELLLYDPESGKLFWKPRKPEDFNACGTRGERDAADWACDAWNGRFAGKEAFTANHDGYKAGAVGKKNYRAHRVAWAIYCGEWPKYSIDHINGVRDDNRIVNLRDAPPTVNGRNIGKKKNNTSGHNGIYWCKLTNKWCASIKVNYKCRNLGRFENINDAIAARDLFIEANGFTADHGKRKAYS